MKKFLPSLALAFIFSVQAIAQNVGIGTNTPQTKLDINGALSARITSVAGTGGTISIPDNVTLFRLTSSTGGGTNALILSNPKEGQLLIIINEDDNAATINGYTIPAGTAANPSVGNFINIGGVAAGWKTTADNNSGANSFTAGNGLSWAAGPTLNSVWTQNGSNDISNNNSSGRVGIGTPTPSGTLDVQGGTATGNNNGANIIMQAQNGGGTGSNGGNVNITSGNGTTGGNPGNVNISSSTTPGNGSVNINAGGGHVNIANSTTDQTIGIGNNATGTKTVTIGGTAANSATTINGGSTGGVKVSTLGTGLVKSTAGVLSNGVIASEVPTTNTLSLSTNTLTSTVNGVAATSSAVSGVSNTSSGNNLSTTVNGVTGSNVTIINSNVLGLSGNNLSSTINGVASNNLDISPIVKEPWNVGGGTTAATTNTQNIYQNGNVGIGDFSGSSPSGTLDVSGSNTTLLRSYFRNNNTGGTQRQDVAIGTSSSSRYLYLGVDQGTAATGTAASGYLDNRSGGKMYFQSGGTNHMVIDNTNGNIGMGIPSPLQKLDINGATINRTGNFKRYTGYNIVMTPVADGTYGGYLILAPAYTAGNVQDAEVQGRFTFSRGSTGSGNRTDVLEVSSKSAYQTEYFIAHNLNSNGGFVTGLFKVTYGGVVYHAVGLTQTGGNADNGVVFDGSTVNATPVIVRDIDVTNPTAYGSVGIIATSTGNVGIGNLLPSSKLDVSGVVNASTGFKVAGGAPSTSTYLKGDGTNFVAGTIQAGDLPDISGSYIKNTTSLQSSSNFNISGIGYFNGTVPMIFTSQGNGTYDIGAVYHNANGYTYERARNADNISATILDYQINQRGGGTPALMIKGNTGNVGIGTTTPGRRFQWGDGTTSEAGFARALGSWSTTYTNHSRLEFNDFNFGIGAGSFGGSSDDDLYLYSYNGAGRDIRFMSTSNGNTDPNSASWATNMTIKGNTGNVGIGTTNPEYKLESYGTAQTTDFVGLTIAGNRTYAAGQFGTVSLNFALPEGAGGLSSNRPMAILRAGHESSTTSAEGFLSFYTRSGGVMAEKVRVTSAGNVGIGRVDPASKLEVRGDGTGVSWAGRIALSNSTADRQVFLGTYNGNSVVASHNYALSAWRDLYLNSVDGTSATANVIISSNLGIGTASPGIKVDVSNGGTIGSTAVSVSQHDVSNRGIKVSFGSISQEFAGMRVEMGAGTNGCGNTADVRFDTWECNTSNSREIMRINGRGNVGIGTTSPAAKLHVEGNIISSTWPAFNVYNDGGGDQSTTGTFNATVKTFDNGNNFNLSTDEFNAPIKGIYQFNWTCYTNSTGGRTFLLVNGGAVAQTNSNDKSICIVLSLNANDKVKLSGNGFAMTWYGAVAHNAFSGHLVMGLP